MMRGKSLLDNTSIFSPNEYGKNDKMILKYFPSLETNLDSSRFHVWVSHPLELTM